MGNNYRLNIVTCCRLILQETTECLSFNKSEKPYISEGVQSLQYTHPHTYAGCITDMSRTYVSINIDRSRTYLDLLVEESYMYRLVI
jgi:hypothetical protein